MCGMGHEDMAVLGNEEEYIESSIDTYNLSSSSHNYHNLLPSFKLGTQIVGLLYFPKNR